MARYAEYGLPTLKNTVSMTKIKNQLKNLDMNLTVKLSNIRINGQLRGCSGFITNNDTQKIVYINTESACETSPFGGKILYRTASHDRDFTGGQNQWIDPNEKGYITTVLAITL